MSSGLGNLMNSSINAGIETSETAVPSINEQLHPRLPELKLKQVVITSVTRDDLPDGGASIFARTIELLRWQDSEERIEVPISDSKGGADAFNQSRNIPGNNIK